MRTPSQLFLPLFLWGLTAGPVFAQTDLTTADFFALAGPTAPAPQPRESTPAMPWFERYELRTETREFDLEQQEYTFRLSPSSGRKRRAQAALYAHQEGRPDFNGRARNCDRIADQYADWLTLFFLEQENLVITELTVVLQDRKTVLNRLAGSLDFDWEELVKVRQAETALALRRSERETLEQQLRAAYGIENRRLSFAGIVDLSVLRSSLPGRTNPAVDPELLFDLEKARRELALEQSERMQYLDFAQIRYRGPHSDPGRERLSVGLGLQLPNSGNQLLKIRELELEEQALQQEIDAERQVQQTDFAVRQRQWMLDYQHYVTVVRTFAEEASELALMEEKLRRKEGFNPLPLLAVQERKLRNQLQQIGVAAALYEDYLDLREQGGDLCTATRGELLLQDK